MKIYNEMQVGKKLDKTDFPLAYLAQYESTKASAKVTENIKSWMGGYCGKDEGNYSIFQNTPVEGFKIVKYVSRYSTSNKWFRVEDPRGFTIEISAENLVELLLSTTIINGVIQGDCVYYNKASLVAVESDIYRDYYARQNEIDTKTYTKPSELTVGCMYNFQNKENEEWTYLGKFGYTVEAKFFQRGHKYSYYPKSETIEHTEFLTSKKAAHFFIKTSGTFTEVKAWMSPSKITDIKKTAKEGFVGETIASILSSDKKHRFYVSQPYIKGGVYETKYSQKITELST